MIRAHQNDLRLIKLLLNAHDSVRLSGILVLLNVCVDVGERDGGRIAERGLGHFDIKSSKSFVGRGTLGQ